MSSSENENYEGKDPMSPEKITSHEPTAVQRNTNEQETGAETDSEEAKEKYRRQGMTKITGDSNQNSNTIYKGNTNTDAENLDSTSYGDVKEGAESTFDKLKAGAKAVGKKIADPDRSIEDEYNREKS